MGLIPGQVKPTITKLMLAASVISTQCSGVRAKWLARVRIMCLNGVTCLPVAVS